MTPYYEHAGVTIYHGDCREILPTLSADLVIADPPYNVGKGYGRHTNDARPAEEYEGWLAEILTACAVAASEVVYFPGAANLMRSAAILARTPLSPMRVLGWHKREFAGDLWTSGPAISWEPIIWASCAETPTFNKLFGEVGRDFLVVNSIHGDPFKGPHPCPKPVKVLRWLLHLFMPRRGRAIDPCAGTGSTLFAAKELGYGAIGIEIEERFCEIAAKRLQQEVFDFSALPKGSQRMTYYEHAPLPNPAFHPEREGLLAAFYGLYLRSLGFSPQYAARETQARYPRVHVPKALLERIETL